MARRRAVAIVDLGLGAAIRGVVTEALVGRLAAHTVVQFNGEATPLGTAAHGVRTLLGPEVLVDVVGLRLERGERRGAAKDGLRVHRRCPVVTPLHAAVRTLEGAHDPASYPTPAHVAAAERDQCPETVLRVGDLSDRGRALAKLDAFRQAHTAALRDRFGSNFGGNFAARHELQSPALATSWLDSVVDVVADQLVDDADVDQLLAPAGTVVLAGGIGLLEDRLWGIAPDDSLGTATFEPARRLARSHVADGTFQRLGVLRPYLSASTRGPLPTAADELGPLGVIAHPNERVGRSGWLDLLLLAYALEVADGVDGLAVTHLEALDLLPELRVSTAYMGAWDVDSRLFRCDPATGHRRAIRMPKGDDRQFQRALIHALGGAVPEYREPLAIEPDPGMKPKALLSFLADALATDVVIACDGPHSDRCVFGTHAHWLDA